MYSLESLENVRILVVDDDEATCLLFSEVLSGAGATVSTANSAISAFTLIETMAFDILVSDLAMPGMNGFEMVMQLREQGWYGLAIAVSSYSQQQDVQGALESGFDDHLAKPVNIAMLVERIAALRDRMKQGGNLVEVCEFVSE